MAEARQVCNDAMTRVQNQETRISALNDEVYLTKT